MLPADGVYGLCALAIDEGAVGALYALKGRRGKQPTAVIAADITALRSLLPELAGPELAALSRLLPGPFTLIVSNPAERYPWLTGERPRTLGVRIALLPPAAQTVLDAVGAVAATSANDPGKPAAASLSEIPARIIKGCAAVVDGGELPGTPSTIVDLTGSEPQIVREGMVSAAETLARLAS